ncbi:hypothetical protein M0R45_007680 [Rubus argutus]|uniref:Uncharacterized protein n=1 Tax=Rubus argutus TaxID=59490 RepID=A0AAW1XYY6_RUBAR
MARGVLNSLTIFVILLASLLLSAQLTSVEARPLQNTSRSSSRNRVIAGESTEGYLSAVKSSSTSGASPPGPEGHRFVNLQSLAAVKNSGPGPGEGHP